MFMKRKNQYLMGVAVLCSGLFVTQVAQASVTFDSSATLTYTINSITNLNTAHPNDLSALAISGYFDQGTDATNYYLATTGDGAVVANNPSYSLDPVSSVFGHSFSLSGSATAGSVDSLHTGLFGLLFDNSGTDSYSVDVSLAYDLSAAVAGLFATNSITLDYFTLTDTTIFGATNPLGAYTLEGSLSDIQTLNGVFNNIIFNIGASGLESLNANVAVTSTIEPAAVPLPGVVWLFLSGLIGIMGFSKRKKAKHA